MIQKDDELLVAALRAGSADAYSVIVERYYKSLRLDAYDILKDNEAADDVVQDVFSKIWAKKEKLPADLFLRSYLGKAIRHRCIDIIRKRSQLKDYTSEQSGQQEAVEQTNPAIIKEIKEKVLNAVAKLPPAQRKVFELFFSGRSLKEIEAETGKSIQTIKNLLCTAKRTLRGKLAFLKYT